MTSAASEDAPLARLQKHLDEERRSKQREGDFDMDDRPDEKVLAPFGELHTALFWLENSVTQTWRIADRAALRSQSLHRLVARIAIISGTSAIVLAVAQLSVKLTQPELTAAALALEGIAIIAALAAVVLGLMAKYDRGWLGQRHLAERLRMLTFRALEQLWSWDRPSWEAWVKEQLTALKPPRSFVRCAGGRKAARSRPIFPFC